MTDRRTGSVGAIVDLMTVVVVNRQTGSVGVTVDLKVVSGATYPLTVSTTQAQAVTVQLLICRLQTYAQLEAMTYGQMEALTYAQLETVCSAGGVQYLLTVSLTQPQTAALRRSHLLRATQATATGLVRELGLRRSVMQGQSVSLSTSRGSQRVVSLTQPTTVALRKMLVIGRRVTVAQTVTRTMGLGRVLSLTQATALRLVRQIALPRSTSQPTTVALTGIPVRQRVVAAAQTSSLGLGRVIALVRSVTQGTAARLANQPRLEPTVAQPTLVALQHHAGLTRTLGQAQAVSLTSQNVTVRYERVVSATVAQSVALGTVGTGAPAAGFVVGACRPTDFVVCGRSARFAAAGRGVRFVVGSRS